jgi:hypothetical protein
MKIYENKVSSEDDSIRRSTNVIKLAKWTIIDTENEGNKGVIHSFHKVALKSAFGYLSVEKNGSIISNGRRPDESSTFRIAKANIPLLADWLYKRQYLISNPYFSAHKLPEKLTKRKIYGGKLLNLT